jgi:enolase
MLELYQSFIQKYGVISIEDPYDQDDFKAWANATATVGKDTQVG